MAPVGDPTFGGDAAGARAVAGALEPRPGRAARLFTWRRVLTAGFVGFVISRPLDLLPKKRRS